METTIQGLGLRAQGRCLLCVSRGSKRTWRSRWNIKRKVGADGEKQGLEDKVNLLIISEKRPTTQVNQMLEG